MIESIKIKLGKKTIELTAKEAEQLYNELHELYGRPDPITIPYPYPYRPTPFWYGTDYQIISDVTYSA